jgi:hypothetical protein
MMSGLKPGPISETKAKARARQLQNDVGLKSGSISATKARTRTRQLQWSFAALEDDEILGWVPDEETRCISLAALEAVSSRVIP